MGDQETNKKICRSTKNKKIFGVCGGLAEYFDVDVTWIRLAFAVFTLCASIGIWAYLICALVLPKDTEIVPTEELPRCPKCGCVIIAGDTQFCSKCGEKLN